MRREQKAQHGTRGAMLSSMTECQHSYKFPGDRSPVASYPEQGEGVHSVSFLFWEHANVIVKLNPSLEAPGCGGDSFVMDRITRRASRVENRLLTFKK